MSDKKTKQLASMNEWQTAHLRLTAFHEPTINVQEIEWWQKIVGVPPESRTFRPKSGELREEGPFETGMLTLNIQPLRIDWHLTKAHQTELPEEDLPTIGEFPKISEIFLTLMRSWLKNGAPKLGRVAFGAVLMLPVQSRQVGYERLAAYLPGIKLDPNESSDFLYQINKPRNSKLEIPDLRVNRLCKWSVAVFGRASMHLNLVTGRSEQFSSPDVYACRLEMDINTAADFKDTLPQDQLVSIFEELVALGKEIIERGDI
jgi:hypothetical protein